MMSIKNLLVGLRVGRKSLASWIVQIFIAFFAIGVVAFLYFLMYGRYFDIHYIVQGNEAKRHVINMGQVLLSSHKLVYEETFDDGTKRFHRGVFDKDKLDNQMVNYAGFIAGLLGTRGEELGEEVSYPQTGTRILVEDIDNGDEWIVSFGGPGLENTAMFIDCLNSKVDEPFWEIVPHYTPWKDWEAEECYSAYEDKLGVYSQEFPVMIYDNGDMHAGRLHLRVMEDYV